MSKYAAEVMNAVEIALPRRRWQNYMKIISRYTWIDNIIHWQSTVYTPMFLLTFNDGLHKRGAPVEGPGPRC